MTKSDLNNWWGVELRNKQRGLLVGGDIYDLDGNLLNPLCSYKNDITYYLKECDIMKARDLTNCNITKFLENWEDVEWDWQRPESKTGRVQIEDVKDGDVVWIATMDIVGEVEYLKIEANTHRGKGIIKNSSFGTYWTKEEAQQVYKQIMAGEEVKVIIDKYTKKYHPEGWVPDFDGKQVYYLMWDHEEGEIDIDCWACSQVVQVENCFPEDVAHDDCFIKEVTEPFKRWLGVE